MYNTLSRSIRQLYCLMLQHLVLYTLDIGVQVAKVGE
jgi:hypothetical protein